MLGVASGLSGCSFVSQPSRTPIERLDFNGPPTSTSGVQQGLSVSDYDPKSLDTPEKMGLSESQSKAMGCNIGDRFDRGAALVYNFKDNQTRLALHLNMNGPSFSDPSNLEFKSVMVRFTHKFSKPLERKRDKCRIQSSFQGIIGSAYNELFIRNNYTVWQELRKKLNLK
jgi:hypothetical protein